MSKIKLALDVFSDLKSLAESIEVLVQAKEVITMEIILEFLKEALKGITQAVSSYLFRKTFLDKKKTTLRRREPKDGSRKTK